jgi:hypothetical protein
VKKALQKLLTCSSKYDPLLDSPRLSKCLYRGPENIDFESSEELGSPPIYTFYIEVYRNELLKGENPLTTRDY